MDIVLTVLILLLAVALSAFCLCVLTSSVSFTLPLPLIQIAIGACLATPQVGLHVTFDPDLFMALFIPPLLFADGWRIPKREFFRQHRAILMLALGLVMVTVVVVGYFLHAMIPEMPLPVAFALAAVLSPTDAIAFGGIAGKGRIPEELRHILNGEALMNDASGLVALKFAIAAALTGVFSLGDAAVSFVIVTIGGLIVGGVVSWVAAKITVHLFMNAQEDDPAAAVVLTLLIPFAAYFVAERVGSSGILAAVAAGMVMHNTSLRENIPTAIRVRMNSTWSMVEFVFNGMVFILLGFQLPHILGRTLISAYHDGAARVGLMLGYVGAVIVALYVLRFVWIWLSHWTMSRSAPLNGLDNVRPGLRTVTLTTIGGVRGAVTLAGVLALPVVLPNGNALPGRDLAIFIASGTILASIIIGVVGVPLSMWGLKHDGEPNATEEQLARKRAARAAIRAVADKYDELSKQLEGGACAGCADASAHVMNLYRRRLEGLGDDETPRDTARQAERVEIQLKIAALQAERIELISLREAEEINDDALNRLMHEIDLSETAIVTQTRNRSLMLQD
jgi:CPA1 family monovalent cation:H+ antiporter